MFLQTVMLMYTRAMLDAWLAALSARPAAALLTTPTIELYTGATNPPSIESLYADFTFANFSGYTPAAVTLSGPVNLGSNTQGMLANLNFIATTASPFVPNVVLGYCLTDGVGVLYASEQFANPVPFAAAGDFLSLDFFAGLAANLVVD